MPKLLKLLQLRLRRLLKSVLLSVLCDCAAAVPFPVALIVVGFCVRHSHRSVLVMILVSAFSKQVQALQEADS